MFQQWYQRVRGEGTGGSLEAGHSVAENLTILWKLCVCVCVCVCVGGEFTSYTHHMNMRRFIRAQLKFWEIKTGLKSTCKS